MGIKIATWNINSIRLREPLICRFLNEEYPHILCLQECKSPIDKMPSESFLKLGYKYFIARGQKSYNGVAIISRIPIIDNGSIDYCGNGDARHVSGITESGIKIENFYIPAGGDLPDRKQNKKFDVKLKFLAEMERNFKLSKLKKTIILGDFNIAPRADDVWSHKQLYDVVSHTQIEIESLEKVCKAGQFVDIIRRDIPEGLLFTWWSYRARDWKASNRGRRLDHIWLTKDISPLAHSCKIATDVRDWDKPSDHVPVVMEIDA